MNSTCVKILGWTAMAILATTPILAKDFVWWEAESATNTNLNNSHPYVSRNKKLSGGVSIGTGGGGQRFAEYTVKVPSSGTWYFYVRKFWKHGPLKWRFDGDSWRELTGKDTVLLDNVGLDRMHMCISWVPLGKVKLSQGTHKLRVEGLENKGAFVLDCFALTKTAFEPSGLKKPGEKTGLADPGKWAFEPSADTFTKDPIGLRRLNEKVAGQSGYVKMDKDGDFVRGDGKRIRFWCVNTGVQRGTDLESLERHAKYLAKRGVNMVRHHGHMNPGPNDNPMNTNMTDVQAAQRLVAVMKKQGIYTTLSPYWGIAKASGSWGIPYHSSGSLFGLVFWDKTVKSAYKKWLKDLLTTPNPYEDKRTPLAKDPALAIFQLQNEDSFYFWTIKQYKGAKLAAFQKVYDAWRQKKGMSPAPLNLRLWEVTNPNQSIRETMQFLGETMRDFNQEMENYLRRDLGCRALVNAGNWRTANQEKLLDLERYSYAANEVIGVNRYVNGGIKGRPHVNPKQGHRTGYAVDQGDYFQDVSVLLSPSRLATNCKQVAGHAFIIPESTWVAPFSYQSEGPFLISAYSSLTGVDGYYWFALGSIGYDKTIGKWQTASPAIMGGFPAASIMFRRGYLKKGTPIVHEERRLSDMWQLKSPIIAEEAGFDPNRDKDVTPKSSLKDGVNPVAYLVGPVEAVYGGDPQKSRADDLSQYVKNGRITSNTGQIKMDTTIGLCTVKAPKAQGATGFLSKAGEINLGTLQINAQNEYATVLAVSLDGKSLKSSKKILLQITTRNRPYGWKQSPTTYSDGKTRCQGFRIDSLGGSPWNVWDTKMTLMLKNGKIKKATMLDENLYPTSTKVSFNTNGKTATIKPPKNAMYIVLQ